MEGERLSSLVLLPVTLLYYTLATLLFFYHRHEHAISDRSSKLSMCRALLLIAASTLLLLHIYLPSASERMSLVSLFIGLVPASLLLLMRTIALTLRLELTSATDEPGDGSHGRTSTDDEVRRLSVHSQRGGDMQQPRPSTSITLEAPVNAQDSDEEEVKQRDEAVVAWLLPYRWMVEGSFLTCLFSPLLVLSLVGVLLLSLLDHMDLSLGSSAVIAVYVLGHVILLAHTLLLLLCCLRHPAWNELRAEGIVSMACAVLLPVSFGLSIASSYASSSSVASTYILTSQYVLLGFYVLTFSSSILFPLLSSLLLPAYLSSSAPMPLETFVDLLHTSEGYTSFLTFLRTEFSEENLLFWKDVNSLDDKRREWDELEDRRRRRDEKDKEKRETDAVTAFQQPTTPAFHSSAVNKPLLSLKTSGGLESLSTESGSTTAQGSESPHSRHSQSISRAASPKSPSHCTSNDSAEPQKQKVTRNTLQPSVSSDARAGRKSEAISPRSASENGRRVVHGEHASSPLPGSQTDDVFLLPSAKRTTSYSTSASPNRKNSGNQLAHTPRQQQASQQLGLTLHPSSIHPTLVTQTQRRPSSAHYRGSSLASTSYTLPFPLDDSWDMDAISKLRRISWSIALEKKAAKHRASRSRDSSATAVRTPQQPIRVIAETGVGSGAGRAERVSVGSLSLSPRSHTPRRLSPAPLALPLSPIAQSTTPTPVHSTPRIVSSTDVTASSSPRPRTTTATAATATSLVSAATTATAAHPPSPAMHTSAGTPHSQHTMHVFPTALVVPSSAPQSPSVVKSPFMQSIVRALQATKLSSHGRREEDERKRDDERRVVLMRELARGACDVYDKYVVAGSVQQVNLPAVIVQQVMERMKEINPLKYNKPKLNTSAAGHGRRGQGGMGGHNGMQHTLGLMRHATMHFLAGAGGGHGAKGKVHPNPALAAKQSKAEEEAKKQRELEEVALLTDVTLLSYPFEQLFADAHHAIEQLMEKDSFKRYLQSPAYDSFTIAYEKHNTAINSRVRRPMSVVANAALVSLSRRGSRLAVITPRTSAKVGDIEEGSEGLEGAAGSGTARSGALPTRRLSDSVSLQLHVRASPREQRSSLSLVTSSPRTSQPSPAAAHRKPLPINTVRIMTPKTSNRMAGTASPRLIGQSLSGGPLTARNLEVRRGSGLKEGEMEPAVSAESTLAAVAAAAAAVGVDGAGLVSAS